MKKFINYVILFIVMEIFFPDDENIKLYKDIIKNQGVDVCRKVIEKEWINESLSKLYKLLLT
jgi:hypothetical protein